MIKDPTHFTENSSSLIDLILVSDENHVIHCDVGDPFLQQELRYHCPVFGVFNFSKPKRKSFKRHTRIWRYDQGNYNLLRQRAATTNWTALQNPGINVYAKNVLNELVSITETCIPKKTVTIRPSDPPWITSTIKRNIRKRKRAYRKAKRTKLPSHWNKFKQLRNKVLSLIRESKKALNATLVEKLKSNNLSSKQWRTILKSIISPNTKSSTPPLEKGGVV